MMARPFEQASNCWRSVQHHYTPASQAVHQHQHWILSPAQTHLIQHHYETHTGLAAMSRPSSIELSFALPRPSSQPWSCPPPFSSHPAPHDSRRPPISAGYAGPAHWRRSKVHSDESTRRTRTRRRPRPQANRVRLCGRESPLVPPLTPPRHVNRGLMSLTIAPVSRCPGCQSPCLSRRSSMLHQQRLCWMLPAERTMRHCDDLPRIQPLHGSLCMRSGHSLLVRHVRPWSVNTLEARSLLTITQSQHASGMQLLDLPRCPRRRDDSLRDGELQVTCSSLRYLQPLCRPKCGQ